MLLIPFLFIGSTELILIGGIALLLFGGKKLPEMMRGLGKGVKEFKDGLKDDSPINRNDSSTSDDLDNISNSEENEDEKGE